MGDVDRLRRRIRVLSILAVLLAGLAAFGWLRSPRSGTRPAVRADSKRDVEQLKARIAAAGYAERIRLLHQLGSSGGKRAVSAVIDTLRSATSDRVRVAAIRQLGRLGNAAARRELVEIAQSERPRLKLAAIHALGEAHAIDKLIEMLGDARERAMRRALINAVGSAGGDKAVATLIPLAKDRDEPLRADAIRALGHTSSAAAQPVLDKLARRGDTISAKKAAISALGQLGNPQAKLSLIRLVQSGDAALRPHAARALANYSGDDVSVLLASLSNGGDRKLALAALNAITSGGGPGAEQAIARALKSGDLQLQQAAISALGRANTPAARGKLIEILNRRGPLARRAVWALTNSDDPAARQALLAAAGPRSSTQLQQAVLSALSNAKGPRVDKTLRQLMRRGSPYTAARALQLLAKRGGPQARQMLLDAFRDGNHRVRSAALTALGQLKDPKLAPMLIAAAKSSSYRNAYAAISALSSIGGEVARKAMLDLVKNGNRSVRHSAAYRLATIGGAKAREALLAMLKNPSDQWTATYALGRMKDPETRAKLRQMLDDPTVSSAIKSKLVRAMAYSRDSQTVLAAARHNDPKIAAAAIRNLGRIGGSDAEQLLRRSLTDPSKAKRSAAVRALGQLGTPGAVDALGRALGDKHTSYAATRQLLNIGGARAMALLGQHYQSSDANGRRQVVQALYRPGPRGRKLLLSALDDSDKSVVRAAAQQLARYASDNEAVKNRLLGLLQSDNRSLSKLVARYIKYSGSATYKQHKQLIDAAIKGRS